MGRNAQWSGIDARREQGASVAFSKSTEKDGQSPTMRRRSRKDQMGASGPAPTGIAALLPDSRPRGVPESHPRPRDSSTARSRTGHGPRRKHVGGNGGRRSDENPASRVHHVSRAGWSRFGSGGVGFCGPRRNGSGGDRFGSAPGNVSVNIFDGVKFHAMSVKGYSDHPPWWSPGTLLQARSGAWWAATAAGLCRYAPVQAADLASIQPQACYARDTAVFQIFEDSKGRIWASTQILPSYAARLMRWDPATKAISWFDDVPDKDELVSAFAEDRDGNIWMGFERAICFATTAGNSLSSSRPMASRRVQFRSCSSITAGDCGSLPRPDSDWSITPAVPHFGVRIYKTSDGLASDAINCMIEDTAGRIYAGTGKWRGSFGSANGPHQTFLDGRRIGARRNESGAQGPLRQSLVRDHARLLQAAPWRGPAACHPVGADHRSARRTRALSGFASW